MLYTPFLTDGGYTRVAIHGRWREQEGLYTHASRDPWALARAGRPLRRPPLL